MFEEIIRGPTGVVAAQLRQRLGGRPLQGEVTLLIAAGEASVAPRAPEDLSVAIARLHGAGMRLKEIARVLARERGLSRRDVYQAGLALGHGQGES
jgi:16S rRNA C1402 (ribose-2'-O) methylase RsmI